MPEAVVVRRLLPAAQQCGRQVPAVGGAADQLDGRRTRVDGRLLREAGVGDERGGQRVDGGDRPADGCGGARVAGECIRVEQLARQKGVRQGARPADGSLTEVVGHVEGESAAHTRRQGTEGDQVGRLLVLGRWAPRLADDDLAPVASDDDRRVEVAMSRARMRPGRLHIQSGNGGGGQRG